MYKNLNFIKDIFHNHFELSVAASSTSIVLIAIAMDRIFFLQDNGDCDGRKLSRLKTLSTVDVAETNQDYKIAVQSLQMLDLHKSQDDNDIQSSL